MILLKSIFLKNFLSHKNTILFFKSNEKKIILGKSGAGKSSLVDALIWSLYGKSRSINKSLVKRGEKQATVSVELLDDEVTYKIERSITITNKHEFNIYSKTGDQKYKLVQANGIKGNQEYLEKDLLHSSYLLFINSIVCMQNSEETFVRQPASKRKDLLLEIIGATNYDDYLAKAKDKITDNKVSVSTLENNITIIDQDNLILKSKADKLADYQKIEIDLKERIETEREKVKNFNEQKNQLTLQKQRLDDKRQELSRLNLTIAKLQTDINKFTFEINSSESIDLTILESKVKELEETKVKLKDLESIQTVFNQWQEKYTEIIRNAPPRGLDYNTDIEKINQELIAVLSEPVEKCLNCGTPYPAMEEKRQIRLKKLENDLSNMQKIKIDYEAKVIEYQQKEKELGEKPQLDMMALSNLRTTIYQLESYPYKLKEAQESKKQVEKNKLELQTKQKEMLEANDGLKAILVELKKEDEFNEQINIITGFIFDKEAIIKNIDYQLNSNQYLLTEAKLAVDKINGNQTKLIELKNEQKTLYDNADALDAIKDAFASNGIKAIVIDLLLPQLEDKVNAVLGKLSDFRIRLETQKMGSGEGVVLEGLFITIIDGNNEEMDYDLYSGSEKMRISYSISEGLASIQKCSFRIIDELVQGLDQETEEKFVDIILQLRDQINQLICISHLPNVQGLFEDRVNITKLNGNSYVS